jgi:hypothetical protein
MLVVQPIISGYSMSMRLDLSMMRPGSQETAQVAFDGARYYRTATGVYLKDFGRGDSDDSAKLYSGQMLDFDGVDDKVAIGDISATCNTLTMTINPATTTEALSCADVQIGYNGSTYFDGFIGNVQLWDAAFDADDVAWDYANCHLGRTADNCPGTDLVTANLKGFWPLIEGAGDVAYDHSGNSNPGTLTNFPVDGTGWSNADALDDPIVCQTALIEWALKTSNNACVPLDTAASTNFNRNYSELNWNSRSYAVVGNGADANPSTALILECVSTLDIVDPAVNTYLLRKAYAYRLRQYQTQHRFYFGTYQDSTKLSNYSDVLSVGQLYHVVCSFDRTVSRVYIDNSLVRSMNSTKAGVNIDQVAGLLTLGYDHKMTNQFPLLRILIDSKAQAIIDDDLAAWVTKQYNKAAAKYGL